LFSYIYFMTQFDASICYIYCAVSLTEISAFLFSRYFFSSRMILFLRVLQAFSAQHSILRPATLDSIQLNPTSSKVLSGTFGRDVGRPRAIRRKGMQDGQRFICSRTSKEQVVNRCVGMCTYMWLCVMWVYLPIYTVALLEPSPRGLRTQ